MSACFRASFSKLEAHHCFFCFAFCFAFCFLRSSLRSSLRSWVSQWKLKAFERGQARASDSLRNSQKCRAFILSDFSWLHRERLKELADGKPRAIQRDAQGLREMQSIHRNSSNFVSLYLCIPVWNAVILSISRDGGRIAYETYCRLHNYSLLLHCF